MAEKETQLATNNGSELQMSEAAVSKPVTNAEKVRDLASGASGRVREGCPGYGVCMGCWCSRGVSCQGCGVPGWAPTTAPATATSNTQLGRWHLILMQCSGEGSTHSTTRCCSAGGGSSEGSEVAVVCGARTRTSKDHI
ncbi:hypothetical protein E2C01_057681 [Portunus trituberculatus]|uniref:Uncharacterized protein n=1 Tax=Portunus trituberculatus TaxID=210409 RepID=A0A5B7GXP3_PORTR|nr:hypothetical protein [Portunus trituberculatus]